jgi:exopolyphosphatase/guanosine-5'-triphosphate,3'-diphosphate pyrophosphatase
MSSVAAIDIGSNSVRLLVVGPEGAERCREMHITRLAEGVDRGGQLGAEPMARTLDVLAGYATLLRQHAVARLRVTATSAARDAQNRDEFFERVERSVGSRPELLSGGAEAALAFAGATADQPATAGPFLTLDIGGGSTEFAFGYGVVRGDVVPKDVLASSAPECSISLDMGCVRVTERFLRSDPPAPAELDAAGAFIRTQLERADAAVPCRRAKTWLGLAGTVTSLAARDAGIEHYDPSVTHGYRLARSSVEALHGELASRPATRRIELLLEPKRAGVIVGGSIILLEVMRHFGLDHITVSERDILDGLAASLRAPG